MAIKTLTGLHKHPRLFEYLRNTHGLGLFSRDKKHCPELQIRGSIEDNSKIIFLISQRKHML